MKPGLTTEEQARAKALYADGRTFNYIGKALCRSRHTIKAFLSRPEIAEQVAGERSTLAERYRQVVRKALDLITDDDLVKSSALQKATVSGICTDKAELLTSGPPIVNIALLLNCVDVIKAQRRTQDGPYNTPQLTEGETA